MESNKTNTLIRILTYIAVLILFIINFNSVVGYIGKALGLFSSFFLGIGLAFILNTPCMAIERSIYKYSKSNKKHLVRGVSIVLTYTIFILIIVLLIRFIIPQLFQSVQGLIANLEIYTDNLQRFFNNIARIFEIDPIDLSDLLAFINKSVDQIMASVSEVVSQIITITTSVISVIIDLFVAIVFSIYFLAGKEKLIRNVKKVFSTYLPVKVYDKISYVYNIVVDIFNKYIIGQFTEAIILGVLCFIGMIIFKFDYPLLISVIIGVLALIPIVGAYIGGFISFMLLLLISPTKAIWFVVFIVVLQQFEGNVIYPRVVGSSVGLPAIWVLLSIIVGGGIAGPLGVLLAVPITSVFYTLLKNDINRRQKAKQDLRRE